MSGDVLVSRSALCGLVAQAATRLFASLQLVQSENLDFAGSHRGRACRKPGSQSSLPACHRFCSTIVFSCSQTVYPGRSRCTMGSLGCFRAPRRRRLERERLERNPFCGLFHRETERDSSQLPARAKSDRSLEGFVHVPAHMSWLRSQLTDDQREWHHAPIIAALGNTPHTFLDMLPEALVMDGFHERARRALPSRNVTLDLHALQVVSGATQSLAAFRPAGSDS